jgi:hypothetical protein
MIKSFVGGFLIWCCFGFYALADCVDSGNTAWIEGAAKPAVLKLIVSSVTQNCTTSGTAFFISSTGEALRARHLVEDACRDSDIKGVIEGSANAIDWRFARELPR